MTTRPEDVDAFEAWRKSPDAPLLRALEQRDIAKIAFCAGRRTPAERLARLLKILDDRADTVDGPEGEPKPNEAMSILGEYELWLHSGWD